MEPQFHISISDDEQCSSSAISQNNFGNEEEEISNKNIIAFMNEQKTYNFQMSDFKEIVSLDSMVKKYIHIPSQRVVVIKFIPLETEDGIMEKIAREVSLHRLASPSPYVVNFFGLADHNEEALLILECMNKSVKQLSIDIKRSRAIFSASEKRNIFHRDIKPQNILINKTGEVKLCDFGESRIFSGFANSQAGTCAYWAPEKFSPGQTYDQRADVWSLGMTLAEFILGQYPYREDFGVLANERGLPNWTALYNFLTGLNPEDIISKVKNKIGNNMPDLCEFLEGCLKNNFVERKTIEELRETNWCKKYKKLEAEKLAIKISKQLSQFKIDWSSIKFSTNLDDLIDDEQHQPATCTTSCVRVSLKTYISPIFLSFMSVFYLIYIEVMFKSVFENDRIMNSTVFVHDHINFEEMLQLSMRLRYGCIIFVSIFYVVLQTNPLLSLRISTTILIIYGFLIVLPFWMGGHLLICFYLARSLQGIGTICLVPLATVVICHSKLTSIRSRLFAIMLLIGGFGELFALIISYTANVYAWVYTLFALTLITIVLCMLTFTRLPIEFCKHSNFEDHSGIELLQIRKFKTPFYLTGKYLFENPKIILKGILGGYFYIMADLAGNIWRYGMIYKKAFGKNGMAANHVFTISSFVSNCVVCLFTFSFFGEINPWRKLLFCTIFSTLLSGVSTERLFPLDEQSLFYVAIAQIAFCAAAQQSVYETYPVFIHGIQISLALPLILAVYYCGSFALGYLYVLPSEVETLFYFVFGMQLIFIIVVVFSYRKWNVVA